MTVKFYRNNYINSSCTLTATSADITLFENLFDNDGMTKLTSSGSDDLTPEVWEIEFNSSRIFESIFIANHNIKSGKIEYWNGSAWADFSTAISWTANTAENNYFEFTEVTTTKILLTMNTTIVADAQKYVGCIRVLSEIGEVERNPSKADPIWSEKSKINYTDDNSSIYVYFGDKFQVKLKFNNAGDTDLALFRSLKDLASPFYVYLGGGDSNTQEGFRVQDMYLVNFVNDFRYKLQSGHLLGVGVKIDLDLKGAY